jgi:hypothetical protein
MVGSHDGWGAVACVEAVNQLLSPRHDGEQFFLGCEVVSHDEKIGCAWKVDKTFHGRPVKGDS